MTRRVSLNVRFSLWNRKVARSEWEAWLAAKTTIPLDMCRRLVRGTLLDAAISSDQVRALAKAIGLDEEILRSADLPRDRGNVLSENLRFLFSSLERGGKKSVASKLGIDPTTVSRWLSGNFEPQPAFLRKLILEFGLPSDTDLLKDPIFLSAEPVSASERRQWLNTRIQTLPSDELKELFPALRRLLEER
jgi:transcriptional regulator with XRE-family HTH domain